MTATPITRGRRPKHLPDGRAALLSAAIHAFAQLGYDGANLRGIARAAKVDASLVRVHFGSKEQLWRACVDALEAALAEPGERLCALSLDKSRSVTDRLKEAIAVIATHAIHHPEHKAFISQHAAETGERGAILHRHLVMPVYECLAPLITEGIAAGVVRAEHPEMYFCLLVNALHPPPGSPVLMQLIAPEVGGEAFGPALLKQVEMVFFATPDKKR
ncbi:TetR/AcrR family transcriptional regulator [Pandoraea fibrosis]|uniref:TetR family transcriptional regulator n=1 Tax=Pandoraea fibrosis TaxID=1891094 RepID=A0A5E4RWS9_9BURK|nr:TetR/AcrR family transcriptional regulator [Pandoraea fibrosis]QHE92695.1 TetR family transcriptional regulator [Pandoraea fibrosis]QHF13748.1 TetR family transcriptional regulator [Pandoraea fibrosis]VVD66872.1 TetR/AcrR family transcriptional regulator [Pandoraea fibrosis]